MARRYQSSAKKSTMKFEVVGAKQWAVNLPFSLRRLWRMKRDFSLRSK